MQQKLADTESPEALESVCLDLFYLFNVLKFIRSGLVQSKQHHNLKIIRKKTLNFDDEMMVKYREIWRVTQNTYVLRIQLCQSPIFPFLPKIIRLRTVGLDLNISSSTT